MDEELRRRGLCIASKCHCCSEQKTISHVLLYNLEIQKVWQWFAHLFQVNIRDWDTCNMRFKRWILSSKQEKQGHIRILIPMFIGWFAWLARNDAKYNQVPILAENIIIKIRSGKTFPAFFLAR